MATSNPTSTNSTSSSTVGTTSETANEAPKGISKGISDATMIQLKKELETMLMFAMSRGKVINTELNPLIESNNLDDLINAHNILAKNIAPATPRSIAYLKALSKESGKSIFRRLPIIRNLVILAIIFLIIFIGSSLSNEVNSDSLSKGVLSNSGLPLFLNIVFLCAISGLGVVFYLLKNVSEGVRKSTLMPEQTIYYIALIVLGLISGLILSEIVSSYNEGKDLNIFNNAVLALLGGFSSDAIFSILQGIIDKIKSIFSSGDDH